MEKQNSESGNGKVAKKTIPVSLPEDKYAAFMNICGRRGYSFRASVNMLIDKFLEQQGVAV